MSKTVHVAITRRVKPGMERAFEDAIRDFFSTAAKAPGALGAQLIRPMPGEDNHVYGIIRSFATKEDHDAFYASETFRDWTAYIQPLVEPDYSRKTLHGMEAFFASNGIKNPPTWKMAAVTWLGVWPCVYLAAKTIGPLHQGLGLPLWLGLGFETLAVVGVLTWFVMPKLSKIFDSWLNKS
jgi:antibiotic biosynthesis monooxygenase (ABM) superfamily enzyme